ncbi:MAG: mannose-6-phosphate isomerase-like protein (cupin superfamily) [Candidatus Latescibacterota bacterium]|jgi:mannose-6-phosphate isomerase-like protein (cupin superfamily)
MLLLFTLLSIAVVCGAETLEERIVANDPAQYKLAEAAHGGAGALNYTGLLDHTALSTNFLFLHAGVLLPKGGIGHHFHHKMEEMYFILDGEAQFTINGRTSNLKGPVAVPCKMGQSHAIYNHTDQPVRWLNFAVSSKGGRSYDAFNLDDDRVGVALDEIPVFVTAPLVREKLRDTKHRDAEAGVLYRRSLRSQVFSTPWAFLDHMVLPPGKATGKRTLEEEEEVYYVMAGVGTIQIGKERAAIKAGDAVAIRFGEELSFANESDGDLELLAIGVAKSP